jgi:hypothetical protein
MRSLYRLSIEKEQVMDKRLLEHGADGDVKSSRPENKSPKEHAQPKTKIDMAPNKHEGAADEPSHSGHRLDA